MLGLPGRLKSSIWQTSNSSTESSLHLWTDGAYLVVQDDACVRVENERAKHKIHS